MRKYLLMAGVVVVAAALVGCAGNTVPARASGKVSYKGTPLKAANVTFHHEAMGPYGTTLAQDGTYDIKDLPEGDFKVTIETSSYNPDRTWPICCGGPRGDGKVGGKDGGAAKSKESGDSKGDGEQMESQEGVRRKQDAVGDFGPLTAEVLRARYTKIPERYDDKEKSGLCVELKQGANDGVDFDLKD